MEQLSCCSLAFDSWSSELEVSRFCLRRSSPESAEQSSQNTACLFYPAFVHGREKASFNLLLLYSDRLTVLFKDEIPFHCALISLRLLFFPEEAQAQEYNTSHFAVWSQRVRVEPEVTAYPNGSVNLRCQFTNSGTTKLTQVSWMFERTEGDRQNIAVFHPLYGASFPNKDFERRVSFTQGTLENPSIKIDKLRMDDAGRYICEYATYPSGNEQGWTTLIMLAKPKNSASAIPVRAGSSEVVVASCEAAQGKPEATISWITTIAGRYNHTSVPERDGTVTVKSEYRMIPTPAENGKEITCVVNQRTQTEPRAFPLKLVVEYPPTVTIEGYDYNWYMGRTDAVLTCQADANPAPTEVTWKLPPSVRVDHYRLLVRKVDETVNTTFVCEVKNSLGSGKKELAATVIGEYSNAGMTHALLIQTVNTLLSSSTAS
ncbi:Nectin-2 [Labeo rohita]|uniref:Nectin-2 n=1 Tax=Labeo rohita TaxID=84645 RepID=A0ABQ8LRA4_LABRO|nr:Nectin-2 [Labeo rohita]